jgi:hypothetical protein
MTSNTDTFPKSRAFQMKNQVSDKHYSTGPSMSSPYTRADTDGRSAIGDKKGFSATKKDVSGMPALFPDNPARRVSNKREEGGRTGVKKANESDVSPVSVYLADGRLRKVMWRISRCTISCKERMVCDECENV